MNLNGIFAKIGRSDLLAERIDDLTGETHRSYMESWLSWYKGNVRRFHYYKVYNGERHVTMKRRSAGMAKTVCEDWAALLMNEKTVISINDQGTQAVVDEIYEKCDFWRKANENIEKAFALSLGAAVVRVDNLAYDVDTQRVNTDAATAKVEFVDGTKIYPLTMDDNGITECAFVSRKGKKVFISMHLLNDAGNYEIHNITGRQGQNGEIIYNEEADYYVFDTQSPLKWFQILKPNIANNLSTQSPLGISVFANAIDALETVDIIYDSFGNEFQYGRKRVYASAEALTVGEDGDERPTFDPNDVVFYRFPKGTALAGGDDKPYVQESTGDLRADAFVNGLNQALNILSTRVGLGENRYRYDQGGITTATQVISENSSMFRTVRRHEILIESVLIGITKALLYAINQFTPQSVNENAEITVKFDDSIIEDKVSERERDMREVAAGLMTEWEYRVKYYGQSEADAKKWVADKIAAQPKITDLFGGGAGGGEGADT